MFNWLKKKKPKNENNEEFEYSFIWYKQMQTGNTTYYTKPFRTKVKAKSYEEAKEKVEAFAITKMRLIIVSEDNFNKTDLSNIQNSFDKINKQMNELFKNLKL